MSSSSPQPAAARRRRARRPVAPLRAWALLVALALALVAGCAPTGHGVRASAPSGQAPLEELVALADPRSHVGPSTALVADPEIVPIAAAPEASLPVTLTDYQGTEVTVADTSRVLALDLSGALARIVVELGLGDQLVGRDTSSAFPEVAHLPLVTVNGHELQAEAILELAPTLIITDTSLGPWDVVLQMRDAGITVVVVDPKRDLATAGDLVRQLGEVLGVPEVAEQLAARTEQEIATTRARIATLVPEGQDPLRIAFLYVRGSTGVYYLFGKGSGADSLIEALGGVDVAGEIGWEGMRPANDEGIVAAQPDVLLVMTKGLESAGGVDGLLERLPALAQTPAGERRRVVDMADDVLLSFGPSTAAVLDALARAIYAPDSLPQPDGEVAASAGDAS